MIAEITAKLDKVVSEMDNLFNTTLLLTETNLEGYFIRVSRGWTELFGFTEEEIASEPWVYFIHPEDVEPTLAVFEKMKAGESIDHFVNRYRCNDGSYKTLLWRAAGYDEIERAKKVGTLFSSAVDITEK